ncbi:MAG: GTP 3',8-cyclase MoaA [Candidatus Atabeyarchaeum deiterrae]
MLRDRFGRTVSNIRISLTQRCNLDCVYCHKEGHVNELDREIFPAEIQRIMNVATHLGINRVKLTGGEPTLRTDLVEVVKQLSSVPAIKEISMTTNGTRLENLASQLREAGLSRVNVTLDSLKSNTYTWITGHDSLGSVLRGIRAAVSEGLAPVKMNVVVLKSVNDSEIPDLIHFSSETGVILQLIELISRDDDNEFYRKYHCDLQPIENRLMRISAKKVDRMMNKRRKYVFANGSEIEIVRPMHNSEFCSNCHRLRLTSDGKLKPCLMREDNLVDVLTAMRQGATDAEVAALMREAVRLREPYYREASEAHSVL